VDASKGSAGAPLEDSVVRCSCHSTEKQIAVPGWFVQSGSWENGVFAFGGGKLISVLPGIRRFKQSTGSLSARTVANSAPSKPSSARGPPQLKASSNTSLILTACPSIATAVSLDQAVDEAREKFEAAKRNNSEGPLFKELLAAAEKKQQENRLEFERCACLRAERLRAFEGSAEIVNVLQPLYEAVSRVSKTSSGQMVSAPRLPDFLDLHLSFLQEGYFSTRAVGAEWAAFPFCYAPPAYVRSEYVSKEVGGGMDGGGAAVLTEFEEEHKAMSVEDMAASALSSWDVGLLAWRLLQARGGVKRFANTLTFEALRLMVFELADAHLTHTHLTHTHLTRRDAPVHLQDFVIFAWRLVEQCVVPEPLPGAAHPQSSAAGGGHNGGGGHNSGICATPPTPTGGKQPEKGQMESVARIKHTFPAFGAHFPETIRKHALLRAGVREHREGVLSVESAAREFRTMCRLVLGFAKSTRGGRKLSYSQQAAALRAMAGNNYTDLVFRQTVVGRASKGSAAGVLNEATRSDLEQMLCFLRWLDRDCDGYISERDFSDACVTAATVDSLPILVRRWEAAAVKVDKPSLKGGVRGVLDKIGGPRARTTKAT